MRNLASVTALAVATSLMGTSVSWAGSAGRKNTAIAATALAVGAWSNHTGRAGRKNTAIVATAGAAYAWTRYSAKKKEENHHKRYARLARADAHPGHITPERAHRVQSAATPPGAIGASLAAAERPALSRADALQAFRIEAPGRDAVRIRHAVARVRLVRDARTGDVAELRILHRAMEALGTVCSGAAAVGDHALVVLTRVVPGTVRDAIMAAAPHHLAGRIDAERAVRATVVGSARGQVLRRKARLRARGSSGTPARRRGYSAAAHGSATRTTPGCSCFHRRPGTLPPYACPPRPAREGATRSRAGARRSPPTRHPGDRHAP